MTQDPRPPIFPSEWFDDAKAPHFIARFPQHAGPIEHPSKDDYLVAARYFKRAAERSVFVTGNGKPYSALQDKYERFSRVARMLSWVPGA